MGVIALVDGEHQPGAVRQALDRLDAERGLAGVVFVGGEEKLPAGALERSEELYGRAVATGAPEPALRRLAGGGADAVVDLADEPAVGPKARVALAAAALLAGLPYEAPGMRLEPPPMAPLPFAAGPKLSVFGTGKRTGKTAVAGHLARLLAASGRRPALVCMGRGGPAEPRTAPAGVGLEELSALAAGGEHAASDYLEGAALAGVPSVGCRRVGGAWFSGQAASTNFAEAAALAASLPVDTLIFEGSGACVPPVEADRSVCVAGSELGWESPYSLSLADLVLISAAHAAPPAAKGRAIRFELRGESAEPLPDAARVALFSTGPAAPPGIEPVLASDNLARREALGADLDRAAAERCDVYLTELKAAAVDLVAARAAREGASVVFLRNVPVGVDCDLDAELRALA